MCSTMTRVYVHMYILRFEGLVSRGRSAVPNNGQGASIRSKSNGTVCTYIHVLSIIPSLQLYQSHSSAHLYRFHHCYPYAQIAFRILSLWEDRCHTDWRRGQQTLWLSSLPWHTDLCSVHCRRLLQRGGSIRGLKDFSNHHIFLLVLMTNPRCARRGCLRSWSWRANTKHELWEVGPEGAPLFHCPAIQQIYFALWESFHFSFFIFLPLKFRSQNLSRRPYLSTGHSPQSPESL